MQFLLSISAAVISLFFLLILCAAVNVGRYVGKRNARGVPQTISSMFLGVMGAVLGLLALLLAFSFSMAASRYSQHKELLIKEANDIGTCYLRADLLTSQPADIFRDTLRQYIDARIAQIESFDDNPQSAATAALQNTLWAMAHSEARADPHSTTAPLVIQSVNDVLDISAEQANDFRAHIPETILWMLLITALASGVLVGYAFGFAHERNRVATLIFIIMITAVIFALLDLDRPRRGLIQVRPQPMLDLKATMK